jgi:Ser/Thr protein kinase RdoA (MazF antagonist)
MQTLRKIHDLTKGKFEIDDRYSFLKKIEEIFDIVKEHLTDEIKNKITKTIENVKNYISDLRKEEFCFVHGDIHHGNVLIDNGEAVGLIDLDWLRIGNKFEDLAFTVMLLLREHKSEHFEFNNAKYEWLINGYGFEENEEEILKDYIRLYSLYDIFIFLNFPEGGKKEYYFNYQLSLLEFFCKF